MKGKITEDHLRRRATSTCASQVCGNSIATRRAADSSTGWRQVEVIVESVGAFVGLCN